MNTLFTSFPYKIALVDLGELEDLYYATCAKLRELLHGVEILLTNGFKAPWDVYFTYESKYLISLGPIKISDFKAALLILKSMLHSAVLKDLLNNGIMTKSRRENEQKYRQQSNIGNSMPQLGPENTHSSHHDIRNCSEEHITFRQGVSEQDPQWLSNVAVLQDTRNKSCGMIFGQLAEKYRPWVINTASEGALIDRRSTPEAPRAYEDSEPSSGYISPYNLNERAKRLNTPGGPAMPCICDPECMCAPLCASDPTQNCLCEENGLFARVTEGMDIDDLDVPDLVRRHRQGSETSGSSVSSLIVANEATPDWPMYTATYAAAVDPFHDQHAAIEEIEKQRSEQKVQASNNTQLSQITLEPADYLEGVLSMSSILASSDPSKNDFWGGDTPKPRRVSSLSYRDALTQPFSKQCDYPPRRSSVAKRLFSSGRNSPMANKRLSTLDQGTRNNNNNTNTKTRRLSKQGGKRSLADVSFTNLKLALRCESQTMRTSTHGQTQH